MKLIRHLVRNNEGATVIETAFALPALIIMIWALVQLGLMFRALAGIQQALGEGARYATLCINPSATGCTAPTAAQIKTKIENGVYGIKPGTFTVTTPASGTLGTAKYFDLTVNYTQPTSLLLIPGPAINVSRSKRVWTAAGS